MCESLFSGWPVYRLTSMLLRMCCTQSLAMTRSLRVRSHPTQQPDRGTRLNRFTVPPDLLGERTH
jgi:hypothetical protein